MIERDDGFLTVNDVARYFAPYADWGPLEQAICDRAVGRTLDVGCGPGRHAIRLREQGLDVVGIDSSPGAVLVARTRGIDAREVSIDTVGPSLGLFDTVLLGGQNIGLLASAEEAPAILSRLASVTRSGGRLLGVGVDPYSLRHPAHVTYREQNVSHGRLPGQQRFRIRDGITASPWLGFLFVSPKELEKIATGTSWQLRDVTVAGAQYLADFVRA
ncbi:class I SAM-dependent methyltransferase [Streptomyces sp. NPDC001513]|uniref:class I SAM-dependent methyltransferase n=1 Tax=Streptomyces sp. NPDC001513 TaxID=3364580 RepID=UPI0036757914